MYDTGNNNMGEREVCVEIRKGRDENIFTAASAVSPEQALRQPRKRALIARSCDRQSHLNS